MIAKHIKISQHLPAPTIRGTSADFDAAAACVQDVAS
jgi:hypothetical protein